MNIIMKHVQYLALVLVHVFSSTLLYREKVLQLSLGDRALLGKYSLLQPVKVGFE